MKPKLNPIFMILLMMNVLIPGPSLWASASNMEETRYKLNQIEQKINQLQGSIKNTEFKKKSETHALMELNAKINQEQMKQDRVLHQITETEIQVHRLQKQQEQLKKNQEALQKKLKKYLLNYYKINKSSAFTKIIQQSNPKEIERTITFYEYLFKSQQKLIQEIHHSEQSINENKNQMRQEWFKKQKLLLELKKNQSELEKLKPKQMSMIYQLNLSIKEQAQILNQYLINKSSLADLLMSLTKESLLQTKHSLSSMQGKIIHPVKSDAKDQSPTDQGLIFMVAQGTPVQAVYSGKVVFSHWLNGYGLLIIIDHGWGFMSLYANNSSLLLPEGAIVNQGDFIAKVGHSGEFKKNGLYFELRHHGKALAAHKWLLKDQ